MVYGHHYWTSWLFFFPRTHYIILCLSGSAYLTWSVIIHLFMKQWLTGSKGRISLVLITAANPGTQQRYHVDNPINLFVLCQIIIQPSAFELLQRLAFYFVMQRSNDGKIKNSRSTAVEDGYEDDEEHRETLCGTCSGLYNSNEFWIGCDICERWFHGKCVRITPAKADQIKQYKCPDCSKKSR